MSKILPDLGNNIRCGNSLIAPDYYDNQQIQLIPDDELYRVNVFSWDDEFPTIIAHGGFNCVIGNPPWGANFSEMELEYLRETYSEIIVRMIDSFMYFVSTSFRILREEGYFGMILPDVFLYQNDCEKNSSAGIRGSFNDLCDQFWRCVRKSGSTNFNCDR